MRNRAIALLIGLLKRWTADQRLLCKKLPEFARSTCEQKPTGLLEDLEILEWACRPDTNDPERTLLHELYRVPPVPTSTCSDRVYWHNEYQTTSTNNAAVVQVSNVQ